MLSHSVHGIGECLLSFCPWNGTQGGATAISQVLLASSCVLLTVKTCLCRRLVLLYELMEGRADGFIAWPGSRENQPAHERVDAQAALQALLDGQEWAKASRCTQSCILEP